MKKKSVSEFKKFNLVRQSVLDQEHLTTKPINRSKDFYLALISNKLALVGIIIFLTIIAFALLFPIIWNDPHTLEPQKRYFSFFKQGYIFGTDAQGRDIWAMLWYATRFSLGLAFFVVVIDLFFGVTLGLLMGYYRKFDRILQFIIKVLTNIPSILILIIVATALSPTFWTMTLGLTLTGWISMSLQVRSQVLKNKQLDYFLASKILGTPWYKQLFNFIPVALPMIITGVVTAIPVAIISEASLGFIGLSVPDAITLGNMINKARLTALVYPQQIIIPVVMLMMITISIQLIGNGFQDVIRKQ